MHPSRVPRASWAQDLRAMKAGGLDTVQAYVFWLHVEEVQGSMDWSDNRNLSAFIDAAADAGLFVSLRIGPWCHGEARNGGWPDWVQYSGTALRTNSTGFLSLVRGWYVGVAAQMTGRYFADGGPIISVQLDNETPNIDYLLALRALAIDVGINPFMFIKTGWPTSDKPVDPSLLFPVSGGYFDEFWTNGENSTSGLLFHSSAPNSLIDSQLITAEAGPGMASSYHRRIFVNSSIATAAIQSFLADGIVVLGMYMYHGGSDPHGLLNSTQEQQGVGEGGANDMPCRTYDFHAPIGEAGQPRPHFHGIRKLALAARAHASWLAHTSTFLPAIQPSGASDTATLRWAARSDGLKALIFLNNIQSFYDMNPMNNLRLSVLLGGGAVAIPAASSAPIDVPSGASMTWAARTPLEGGMVVEYALASPLGDVWAAPTRSVAFFAAAAGVRAELAFRATTVGGGAVGYTCAASATCSLENGLIIVRSFSPVTQNDSLVPQIVLAGDGGVSVSALVLDADLGARLWVHDFAGARTAFLSDATTPLLTVESASPKTFTLLSTGLGAPASVWLCPAPASLTPAGGASVPVQKDGLFGLFTFPLPPRSVFVTTALVSPAGPPRVIPKGPNGRAQAPARDGGFGEFANAGAWNITITGTPAAGVDVRLVLSYNGDAARIYPVGSAHERGDLILDHFFNGHDFEIPLSRFNIAVPGALELRVLPQGPRDVGAPVYFEVAPAEGASLQSAEIVETASLVLSAA